MPQKKNAVRTKRADKKRAARRTNTIQYVAVGVILIAVVLIARLAMPSGTTEETVTNAPQVTAKQYSAPPPMTIDTSKEYYATVKMAKGGEFVIKLLPDKAPITVNNFVFLAREGYYDGTTFHRVLADFMAQGGDPTGTGAGDPGYEFENEDSDLTFDKAGVVAMANAGPDTNGSQFFIVTADACPWLDGKHTVFGQVTAGMDAVDAIEGVETDSGDRPLTPVVLERVELQKPE